MDTNGHDSPPNPEVNPLSLAQGHEPDKINTRILVYVPVVLIVCFIMAWLTVTWIIGYARSPSTDKPRQPLAAERNAEPINERLARINSSTPLSETREPRLEGLERLQTNGQPVFMKSYEPTPDNNAPHYHPEDLRPSSPLGKKLGLDSYSWIKEGETARIPVTEAMKAVLHTKNAKSPSGNYITVKKNKDGKPVELGDLLQAGPTASNPQRSSAPKVVPTAHPEGEHKGEH